MTDSEAFFKKAGWDGAETEPLPADFSTRRFARVRRGKGEPQSAILMQAAPDQKTPQFIAIAELLRRCGLSAPEVYAADANNGLVLMEDFGDTTFGRLLDEGRNSLPLYRLAVDVFVKLHKAFEPSWIEEKDLPTFTADVFVDQAALFLDAYFPYIHKRIVHDEEREEFQRMWREALKPIEKHPQTLMLRDFMPDNLMDLPKRMGVQRIGLLDFQDGGLGPLAYDLASLCECVRRDVPPELLEEMTIYYHRQNPIISLKDLQKTCRVLSAQRHVRVLGVIARLAQGKGRTDKLAYLPRVKVYLAGLLKTDALVPVRTWFDRYMD